MAIHLAGCFTVNSGPRLLVIHRNAPGVRWWEVPGGKVNPGELSAYAAEREAKEELGIIVKAVKRLYTYRFDYGGQTWEQDLWWTTLEAGRPYPQEAKHDAAAWMSLEELRHHEDVSPALAHLTKQLVDGEVSF